MKKMKKPPCQPGQVIKLEINDLNHMGEGVGKTDGFTLFVPGALPGEVVSAEVKRLRKNHGETRLLAVEKASPNRITPHCKYFFSCGGCQLQHLDYTGQLAWKKKRVAETLKRIAGLDNAEIITRPVLGMENPWHYRNKARVHFSIEKGRVTGGFYRRQSHRLINIEDCPALHPHASKTINTLRTVLNNHTGKRQKAGSGKSNQEVFLPVKEATIRTSFATGSCLVTLIPPAAAARKDPGQLKKEYSKLADILGRTSEVPLSGITLLIPGKSNRNHLTLWGEPGLEEIIEPFRYHLSPDSFFQVNPQQAAVLYEQAASLCGRPRTAFDLYCGTGNFSLYLGQTAEEVIGVDSEAAAIKDAKENAVLNEMLNLHFVHARVEETPDLLDEGRQPKAIVLNPPRQGCSQELLDAVSKAGAERIIYISCNPATLARDLNHLQAVGYSASIAQPLDMFPHTGHVETVALLQC